MNRLMIKSMLSLLTILCGVWSAATAQDRFYTDASYLAPGETLSLAFSLSNEQVFYGFQTDIHFPEGIEVVSLNGRPEITPSSRLNSSFSFVSNLSNPQILRIGAFSSTHAQIEGDNGVLFSVKIKVSEDFTGGELSITNSLFTDASNQDVTLSDFTATLRNYPVNSLAVDAEDVAVGNAGGVSVELNNEVAITALQTDLYLPAGVSVVPGSLRLGERVPAGHQIEYRSYEDGRVRIVIYSLDNLPFAGNEGELFSFEITVAEEYDQDWAVLKFENTVCSAPNGYEMSLQDAEDSIMVIHIGTGVDVICNEGLKIESDGLALHISGLTENAVIQIYSVDGKMIANRVCKDEDITINIPSTGIYIIRQGATVQKIAIR